MSLNFESLIEADDQILDVTQAICQQFKEYKNKNFELLGLENLDLDDIQDCSPKTVKNIKCLLFGINEKLKVLDVLRAKLDNSEKTLAEELRIKKNMQENFKKTCCEFFKEKKIAQSQVADLNAQIRTLAQSNSELRQKVKDSEDYKINKELEIEILANKIKLLENRSDTMVSNDPKLHFSSNQQTLSNFHGPERNPEYYCKICSEYEENFKILASENDELKNNLQEILNINQIILNSNSKLQQDSIILKNTLLEQQAKLSYTQDLEGQVLKLKKDFSALLEENDSLVSQIKTLTANYQESSQNLYNEKFALTESNRKLVEDNIELKFSLNSLENKCLELQSKCYENSQSNNLAYTLLTEQNLKLLQDSKDFCEITERLENSLVDENSLIIGSFLNLSEDHLLLQRMLSRVLLFMRDKELENLLLRECVNQYQKQRMLYVPVRGDYLDNQLANFLNSSLVPCEVPFVRIEPGVYLFGTKRVVLKVENIGICIRVGGGFIKLEDFISNQTQFEVGKLKERELKRKASMPNSPLPTSPMPKSPMPKSPMPTSPLPKSPEPQYMDRLGSPKMTNSAKSFIINSPKGLSHKKSTLPPQPPKSNKRKNTIV